MKGFSDYINLASRGFLMPRNESILSQGDKKVLFHAMS